MPAMETADFSIFKLYIFIIQGALILLIKKNKDNIDLNSEIICYILRIELFVLSYELHTPFCSDI